MVFGSPLLDELIKMAFGIAVVTTLSHNHKKLLGSAS